MHAGDYRTQPASSRNITDYFPVTETITDITINPNGLFTRTLFIARDILTSLPAPTVTLPTLPMHVNTKFLAGLVNVHTPAFKILIGCSILAIVGFAHLIFSALSAFINDIIPYLKYYGPGNSNRVDGSVNKDADRRRRRKETVRIYNQRQRDKKNLSSGAGDYVRSPGGSGGGGDENYLKNKNF